MVIKRGTSPRFEGADHRPHAGLALRYGRELTWSRLVLAEDSTLRIDGSLEDGAPRLLEGIDLRDDIWTAQPRAITSMASAISQLATGGLSLFEVWKNRRVRQRHYLRPYFKSSGLKLVWRIDF